MHDRTLARETVAVTCASSRMGQAVMKQLAADGYAPRAISRTAGIFDRKEFVHASAVKGDFSDVPGLAAAFEGVDVVCSALPSLAGENAVQYAHNFVAAAQLAGVSRIVHNSMMWAPDEPCGQPFYDAVLELEDIIAASGIDVTIFRPVLFMDNLVTGFARPNLVDHGVYSYCQKPGLASNWIAMDDVAKFMTAALTRDDLVGRRIVIGGAEPLVVEQVVEILSEAIGRTVRYEYEEPYGWSARVHDEMGLGAVMPRDVYSEAMGLFYTFNNESPHRPFRVDMLQVLDEIPIPMEGLREWALRQDWSPKNERSPKIGSLTA